MASVQGTQPDQSWGLSLPGGFHQEVQPTLYDVNFLLPRPNPLVPAVITQNTVGTCYDRGYIDLPPTRKETTRQYITDPSSYVQDLHPFGLGGGTGGVDNLSMLSRFGHPLPYADNEATEEIGFLAKRESALERVDPLSNGYAAQILGHDGRRLLRRHEISKENIAKRNATLAGRAELTLRNGMAIHGKRADIGAANQIASESAAAIDRAARAEIARRARVATETSTAAAASATETVARSTAYVEDEEEETKDEAIFTLDAYRLPTDAADIVARELERQRVAMLNAETPVSINPDSSGATAGAGGTSFNEAYAVDSLGSYNVERDIALRLFAEKYASSPIARSNRPSEATTVVNSPQLDMSATASSGSDYMMTPYQGARELASLYSAAIRNSARVGAQSLIGSSQNADSASGVGQTYDTQLRGYLGNQNVQQGTIDYNTAALANTNVQLANNANANNITGFNGMTPDQQANVGATNNFVQLVPQDPEMTTQRNVSLVTPKVGNRISSAPGQAMSNARASAAGMTDTPHMTQSPAQAYVARRNAERAALRPNQNGSAERLQSNSMLGSNIPTPRTAIRGTDLYGEGRFDYSPQAAEQPQRRTIGQLRGQIASLREQANVRAARFDL